MYNDLEDDYVEYLVCGIKSCRVYLYKFYQRSRRENQFSIQHVHHAFWMDRLEDQRETQQRNVEKKCQPQ